MTDETRRTAGWFLIILPTVVYGGVSLLSFLIDTESGYLENTLRQDLWRAGHAHAGVLLLLTLSVLPYLERAALSKKWKQFARFSIPSAAIFLPLGFFFSVLKPDATEPNGWIYLAYIGAVILTAGLLTLGVGLVRKGRTHIKQQNTIDQREL
ncbi:hypothetical protein [Melghirimyces algeriensis]|uniref:Uncharacterized protein n=1 Tax=Melghirimyces algeriensis TaxID=910412 RepID=A0A521CC15_9BACL|nr:hypothetical protein [Melghirimyces algeriensis]SMO56966.1 hypothetical protein SAMN06264849_103258 [Melghirimyces algeriensis]